MFEKAKKVCTEYAEAKSLVSRHRGQVAYFRNCVRESVTRVERFTFERELNKLTEKIGPAAETIALYETAVGDVTGRPRLVLRQIYEEGRKWKDVVDENGVHISDSCIAADLKKAHKIMEVKIRETQQECEAYLREEDNAMRGAGNNAEQNADNKTVQNTNNYIL